MTEWPRTKADHDLLAQLVKRGNRSHLLIAGTHTADCGGVPDLPQAIIDIVNGRYMHTGNTDVACVTPTCGGSFVFRRRCFKDAPHVHAEQWVDALRQWCDPCITAEEIDDRWEATLRRLDDEITDDTDDQWVAKLRSVCRDTSRHH